MREFHESRVFSFVLVRESLTFDVCHGLEIFLSGQGKQTSSIYVALSLTLKSPSNWMSGHFVEFGVTIQFGVAKGNRLTAWAKKL